METDISKNSENMEKNQKTIEGYQAKVTEYENNIALLNPITIELFDYRIITIIYEDHLLRFT